MNGSTRRPFDSISSACGPRAASTASSRPRRDAPDLGRAGRTVLLEAITRTLGLGHPLTQGTADSNEVWIEIEVGLPSTDAQRSIGHSGRIAADGVVDPWAKFLDVWLLDRDGNRIEARNPEDIFVPLYNHQIRLVPPTSRTTAWWCRRTRPASWS